MGNRKGAIKTKDLFLNILILVSSVIFIYSLVTREKRDNSESVEISVKPSKTHVSSSLIKKINKLKTRNLLPEYREKYAARITGLEAVQPLLDALRGYNSLEAQESMVGVLVRIGEPALEQLFIALKDKDTGLRESAAMALGRIKSPRAVISLIAALKNENVYVLKRVAEALGTIGDTRAILPLIKALQGKDGGYVMVAFKIMGDSAVDPLIMALKDQDSDIREGAAWALSTIYDSRAFMPLLEGLKDNNIFVRLYAAKTLRTVNDSRVLIPFIVALGDKSVSATNKQQDRYLSYLAEGIGETRDPRGVDPLIKALEGAGRYLDLEKVVFNALIKIGSPSVQPLITLLPSSNSGWRTIKIVNALGKIKDPRAVKPLIKLLNARDVDLRKEVASALAEIGDTRSVKALVKHLTEWDVMPAIADALIKLGWKPQSDSDSIHLFIAKNDRKGLKRDWKQTKKLLLRELAYGELEEVHYAIKALIRIGDEEMIPPLLKKLKTTRDSSVVLLFLNSGHPKLISAAEVWAKKWGYYTMTFTNPTYSSSSSSWGR